MNRLQYILLICALLVIFCMGIYHKHGSKPIHYHVDYTIGIYNDTVTVYDGIRVVVKCHKDSMWYYIDKDNE